jgi:[amino group carrier protein]-lysine/ornithine hydrolase
VNREHGRNRLAEREHAVALLREMVAIASPSRHEERLAQFLSCTLAQLGFRTRIDAAGNVVGEIGAGRPVVLLVGHLDTAGGAVTSRDGLTRIYGRGAVDAKGPLAALIVAAARRGAEFPGTIVVAGVTEEETSGSRGSIHLRETLDRPDAVIVGEPGGWPGVTIGYKGMLEVVYRVHRPASHPAAPVEKALELAAAFWAHALEAVSPNGGGMSTVAGHAAFDRIGATLCAINGNAVFAQLRLALRTPAGVSTDELYGRLERLARGGELRLVSKVDAVVVDRRSAVVRALSAAIRRRGGTPLPKLKTGTADMNVFAERWDVPMATYGPGDSRLSHGADEHVEIDDYLNAVHIVDDALRELPDRLEEGR